MLFLYPHSVIKDEIVRDLFRNEYEVYLVHDHLPLVPVLRDSPGSLLFCNIEHGMAEPEWDQLIRDLLADDGVDCRPGGVSQHGDRALAEKYLMEIGFPCGFITTPHHSP